MRYDVNIQSRSSGHGFLCFMLGAISVLFVIIMFVDLFPGTAVTAAAAISTSKPDLKQYQPVELSTGGYITVIQDQERFVTCYIVVYNGTSTISCVKAFKKDSLFSKEE